LFPPTPAQHPDELPLLGPERGPLRAEIHHADGVPAEVEDEAGELVLARRGVVGLDGVGVLAERRRIAGLEVDQQEGLVLELRERDPPVGQLHHVAHLLERPVERRLRSIEHDQRRLLLAARAKNERARERRHAPEPDLHA
jgi:hypothetical protein